MTTTQHHSLAAEFAHDQAPEAAESIARQELGLRTLETRNSDSADFHDIAVWNLKAALEAAYAAGVETALQAAEQAAEHAAEAEKATAPKPAQPTPDIWLVMQSGKETAAMAAFDTHAEAMVDAEERAEKNQAQGVTDTAIWVQPAYGFQPWM